MGWWIGVMCVCVVCVFSPRGISVNDHITCVLRFQLCERQFNKEEWNTHLMWPLRQVPRGEKTQTTHTH